MTTITEHVYKEYRIPLGDNTLVLNESAYQALQYLIKEAKREALLEAAEFAERIADRGVMKYELRKMADEL